VSLCRPLQEYFQRASSPVEVLVGASVELSADRDYARPGDVLALWARASVGGSPLAGEAIEIRLRLGTLEGTLLTGTTGPDGTWSATWTVPYRATTREGTMYLPCNRAELYARLARAPYASSPAIEVSFAHPTRLIVTTDKDGYAPGEPVAVTVRLEYRREDGSWAPLAGQAVEVYLGEERASAVTGSDGTAVVMLTAPRAPGAYAVRAEFAGAGLA